MARIHTILQGFVDINLETDENVNTKIASTNQLQQVTGALNLNSGFVILRKSTSVPDRLELPVHFEVLLEKIGVNILSVQSAHIQGSRLYGVESFDSDWDLSVISSDVVGHRFVETSIDGNDFDVHLFSKEEFQNRLNNHEMRQLEFLSHPEKFFIINNKSFSVELDNDKPTHIKFITKQMTTKPLEPLLELYKGKLYTSLIKLFINDCVQLLGYHIFSIKKS